MPPTISRRRGTILAALGRGREVAGIGLGFTACSPLPAHGRRHAPRPSSSPTSPHAYVKLWKHGAAQPYADAINAPGGAFLANFGGKVSGEWLLAKAAQLAAEAPRPLGRDRPLHRGRRLAGLAADRQARPRSLGFAAYKAQYLRATRLSRERGRRLSPPASPTPARRGIAAGELPPDWRRRTGIAGAARVAVAVIDSHVVLPAVGAARPATSSARSAPRPPILFLDDMSRPAAARASRAWPWTARAATSGATRPARPRFGDMLGWFARSFPRGADPDESFARLQRRGRRARSRARAGSSRSTGGAATACRWPTPASQRPARRASP